MFFIHTYRCARVAKTLHNLFVIKDIYFFFFFYMIAAFLLHIHKILRYIYRCLNIIKTLKLCFFKWNLPSLISYIEGIFTYIPAIIFDLWRFFYQNFELQGCVRKFVPFKSLHIN
jgi:hypothetical protein